MTTKIDVLLPVRNAMPYLHEALESLQNQTFADFRVLVLDHGSVDGSSEVIESFCEKDSRFVHIRAGDKKGLSALLNHGLDLCTAPFIARQDADDISCPLRFEKSLKVMESDPAIAVLGSNMNVIDANGNSLGRTSLQFDAEGLTPYFFFDNPIAQPTTIFSKYWVDKFRARYGIEFVPCSGNPLAVPNYAEDYFMIGQLAIVGKVVNLEDCLVHYRWHGNNTSIVKYVEQANLAFTICHRLAQMSAELNGVEKFDPRPVASHGQRIISYKSSLSNKEIAATYKVIERALKCIYPGSRRVKRELAYRYCLSTRCSLVMLLRYLFFVCRFGYSKNELVPFVSYFTKGKRGSRCLISYDGGTTLVSE